MKRCPKKQPKTQYSVRETVVFLFQDVREMLETGYSKGEIAEVFASEGCEISRHFWQIYRRLESESAQNKDTAAQNVVAPDSTGTENTRIDIAPDMDESGMSASADTGLDSPLETEQTFSGILKGRFEIKPDTEDL